MTVGELISVLEDYGEHLEVVLVGPDERPRAITEVSDQSTPDGVVVELVW